MRGLVDKLRSKLIAGFRAIKPEGAPDSATGLELARVPEPVLFHEPFSAEVDKVAEASRLSQDLLKFYQEGNVEQAAAVAQQLVDLKRAIFGDRHPEFASAVCHRALLLQGLGNLKDAESGLRLVLDIRQQSLGSHHPLVAMTLSQLAMLLIESQQWNQAESSLAQSLAIRRDLLGDDHPNVVADLKVLETLARRKAEVEAINATPHIAIPPAAHAPAPHYEPLHSPGATDIAVASSHLHHRIRSVDHFSTTNRDIETINNEMHALAGAFTRIGSGMAFVGKRMMTLGYPPDSRLLFDATSCQRQFASLCDEAIRRAEELELDLSPYLKSGDDRLSLPDLHHLFDDIVRLETESAKHYAARKAALALVARVLELTHSDPRKSETLEPVYALAASLQNRVKESDSGHSPDEAHAIVEGSHPLVAIDRLSSTEEELDDETWSKLYDNLATSQGKKLAAAAARKRLKPRNGHSINGNGNGNGHEGEHGKASDGVDNHRVTDLMDSLLDDEDFMPHRADRDARSKRVVAPEPSAITIKPRSNVEAETANPTHTPPVPVSEPEAQSVWAHEPAAEPDPIPPPETPPRVATPHSRPAVKDEYDFLRTQTSFICQKH